jgi:lipid-binding SYLF domain-containing protein
MKVRSLKIVSIAIAGILTLATANVWAESGKKDSIERMKQAAEVLREIQNAPDLGIPNSVLDNTKCIIVVPNLIKGGFVFGGKHGRGVATCRTPSGWSAPAMVSVGGGSWGLQIGVQDVDLVMVVMNNHGVQQLLSSKFELSGEGSVAAGPVGRQAVAGTDWKLNTEILSYSRTKGIFAGLTLEGAVVEQDNDSTRDIYGRMRSFRSILSGKVATPAAGAVFVNQVRRTVVVAKENQ